jgi:hypothetical protein
VDMAFFQNRSFSKWASVQTNKIANVTKKTATTIVNGVAHVLTAQMVPVKDQLLALAVQS